MKEHTCNTSGDTACGCPFCDVVACPDPRDTSQGCGVSKKVAPRLLDTVGLYCPVPVMRAKEEIDGMEPGSLLEIIADDPAAGEDIPRWAKRTGHVLLEMRRDDEEFHFLVQKKKEDD